MMRVRILGLKVAVTIISFNEVIEGALIISVCVQHHSHSGLHLPTGHRMRPTLWSIYYESILILEFSVWLQIPLLDSYTR